MPNPNAIVAAVTGIEPALDRPATEVLRDAPRGLTVEFEGERRVRLDPDDPRSPGLAEILDALRQQSRPAYIEVDPGTGAISRVRIPRVTHVVALTAGLEGDLLVEIPRSHAGHVLRHESPDFGDWEALLRDALDRRLPVVLTENDQHEIVDLRWHPNPDEPLPRPRPGLPRVPWWPFRWFLVVLRLVWRWWSRWLSALTPAKAQQMFALVAATSCDPLTVPPPCIPFLYPDDGCWARAHEMCRLMLAAGVTPRKVWIYGSDPMSLHVDTKNHPTCAVSWNWHVAPTLWVRGPSLLQVKEHVIDPSLFGEPVPTATWKGAQDDPSAQLVDTAASAYYRWKNGSIDLDPNYTETNAWLADYRLDLKLRALDLGPPPYASCP